MTEKWTSPNFFEKMEKVWFEVIRNVLKTVWSDFENSLERFENSLDPVSSG